MTAIAQLEENRTVEGVYAVAKKERLRTRNGAAYLALELVDPSGRISARVWNDVELLDARFAEGDAVRVLGRVERFRDRLQLEVRTLEPAQDVDPASMAPAMRRDADELEGFLEFLVAEISHDALRGTVLAVLDKHTVATMLAQRARPKRPSSTTPTSSTQSPRQGPSPIDCGSARAEREPRVGFCRFRSRLGNAAPTRVRRRRDLPDGRARGRRRGRPRHS